MSRSPARPSPSLSSGMTLRSSALTSTVTTLRPHLTPYPRLITVSNKSPIEAENAVITPQIELQISSRYIALFSAQAALANASHSALSVPRVVPNRSRRERRRSAPGKGRCRPPDRDRAPGFRRPFPRTSRSSSPAPWAPRSQAPAGRTARGIRSMTSPCAAEDEAACSSFGTVREDPEHVEGPWHALRPEHDGRRPYSTTGSGRDRAAFSPSATAWWSRRMPCPHDP